MIRIASDDDSSGMLSRVNKNNATAVSISTAIPWASGVIACNTLSHSDFANRGDDRLRYPRSHLLSNEPGTVIATNNSREPFIKALEIIDIPVSDADVTLE